MHKPVKRKWSGKSRGGKLGYLFFIYTIKLLGIKIAYCFLALVVIHFIPFAPKATNAIWLYNRKRLHYGTLKSILKLYQHYYVFQQTQTILNMPSQLLIIGKIICLSSFFLEIMLLILPPTLGLYGETFLDEQLQFNISSTRNSLYYFLELSCK